MAKLSCTCVLVLLGAVVAAATKDLLYQKSGDDNGSRLGIYKGKTTTIKKHPYLVAVQYGGSLSCAGSIISNNWVLTSADCIFGSSPSDLAVIAGTEDGSTGGKTYKVKQVVTHPSYGASFLDYDYGLLQIKGKFKWSDTVKSVNLPKKAAKAGSKAVIVGWGDEGEDATLKQGTQSVLSLKECAKIYDGFGLDFNDRLLCTYNKGKVSACTGDWADPITEKNVVYSLFIAVGSAGQCSKDALPSIGANVKTAVPWIQNVTGLTDY